MKNKFWYMHLITNLSALMSLVSLVFMMLMYLVFFPDKDANFRLIVAIPLMIFISLIFGLRIAGEILTDKIKKEKIKRKIDPTRFSCIMQFDKKIEIEDIMNNLKPIFKENRFKIGKYHGNSVFILSTLFTAPKILRLIIGNDNKLLIEAFTVITKRRSRKTFEEDFDGYYDAISKHQFKSIVKKIIAIFVANNAEIISMSEKI